MSTGIGLRIRNRRNELGISQEALAARMGLKSKSTICKIERGDDNLTSDTVSKYAEALNTSPAYLMGWDKEMPPIEKMDDDSETKRLFEMIQNASPEVRLAVQTLLESATKQS